ncbi:MAG: Uma2 family endonuclease [Polyangiaceae bacterium]|nr:Uma2 family endonuclease [Polyangiaceae bacterium]MCL4750555.1 Uma2 family endonuclease [Myxococcales bacterium]
MTTARRLHYDYAEYLASLETSLLKLEYCRGVIYAMAGGTPAHAQLAAATIVALAGALPAGCRVATSDLKVRVARELPAARIATGRADRVAPRVAHHGRGTDRRWALDRARATGRRNGDARRVRRCLSRERRLRRRRARPGLTRSS